jgi:hypothetical protein
MGILRHIDHIVVAVRDLDRAADAYRGLGFQVGARNRHPWGTENRLIQFRSSFVELITIGAGARIPPHEACRFSFGAFVRDYLEEREGLAMLVLSSSDARSDAALFAARGVGDFEPFSFERTARRPDGSETRVAFTLAFASDPHAPHAGFFVCQHHAPQNFWNSRFQQHANGASNIAAVTLTAPDPTRHVRFLTEFSGAEHAPIENGGSRFALDEGRIDVEREADASTAVRESPLFTSFSVKVDRFDDVASTVLFGVELRFER